MTTIFLDESGDLGTDLSKRATSRHFILTALVCDDPRPVENAVKQIFRGFSKTERKNHHGSLHATHETAATRRRLLTALSKIDILIYIVRLDKRESGAKLRGNPQDLYNSFAATLIGQCVAQQHNDEDGLRIVASQRETKSLLNQDFVSYLESQVTRPATRIEIRPATNDKGLQAVDIVSWSYFRQIERHDGSYTSLIDSRLQGISEVSY